MFAVIRNYTEARGFADDLKKRSRDIESELSSAQGFIAYYLLKTASGATSVTICDDRAGCDESTKRAANWLRQNMPNLKINPPETLSGEVSFTFAKSPAKV